LLLGAVVILAINFFAHRRPSISQKRGRRLQSSDR
jgi:hypothetical protein